MPKKPVYLLVSDGVKSQIAVGELKGGDFLPAERQLCESYGVSRDSVKRAISTLEDEGVVQRQPGCRPIISQAPDISAQATHAIQQQLVAFVTGVPFSTVLDDSKSCLTNVVHHVMRRLSQRGMDLTYINIDNPDEIESKMQQIKRAGFGGVVYFQGGGYTHDGVLDAIRQSGSASVVIEGYMTLENQFTCVDLDNAHGGYIAGKYLIEQGHTALCHIMPEHALPWANDRWVGFQRAGAEAGIPSDQIHCLCLPNLPMPEDMLLGSDMIKQLVQSWRNDTTGVFASTDAFAACMVQAAGVMQLTIPDDVSLIGFDNIPIVNDIGLTSVSHMTQDIGELAAERLLARMADPHSPYVHHDAIKPKLIIRESVAAR